MKISEEIRDKILKKERDKIKKEHKPAILNYFNRILNEYFSIKEPITQENKSKIFLVYNSCIENEIDFIKFIDDIISNWAKYQKELKIPKWIMYPKLDFISKERTMFIFGYKNNIDNTKIKREVIEWE